MNWLEAERGVWVRAKRGLYRSYYGKIVQRFPSDSEWCEVQFTNEKLSHTVRIADLESINAIERLALVDTE